MSARPPGPLDRFSATAADYRRYRPGYPAGLATWILDAAEIAAADRVLDVGCGTGIVTRLFLERGFDVVGVDPNRDMLAVAREDLPRVPLVCARSEELAFGPGAFSLVLCGQAFHWFETHAALSEFERVARPGAWSVAFWNERRPDGLAGEYDRALRAHSSEYVSITRDDGTFEGYRLALSGFELRETRLPNKQTFDLEGFLGRARSASYFVHGVADKPALTSDLEAAFARCQEQGTAEFRYDTVALMWRPRRCG